MCRLYYPLINLARRTARSGLTNGPRRSSGAGFRCWGSVTVGGSRFPRACLGPGGRGPGPRARAAHAHPGRAAHSELALHAGAAPMGSSVSSIRVHVPVGCTRVTLRDTAFTALRKKTPHLRGRPMGRPAESLRRQGSASGPVIPCLTPPLPHYLRPVLARQHSFLTTAYKLHNTNYK